MVWEHNLTRGRARNVINPGNYFAVGTSTSLDASGVFSPTVGNLSGDGGAPEELRGVAVKAADSRHGRGAAGDRPSRSSKATRCRAAPRTIRITQRGCGNGASAAPRMRLAGRW